MRLHIKPKSELPRLKKINYGKYPNKILKENYMIRGSIKKYEDFFKCYFT